MHGYRWLVAITLCACGPTVAIGDDDTTGDASTDDDTTTPSPTTSATTTSQTTAPSTMSSSGDPTTTATTVDPDTTDSDSDSDSGCNFLGCDFDIGPRIPECSPFAQDCAKGEKCVPWANDGGAHWNATRCSPVPADPAAIGEPCLVEGGYMSGIDDCELGAICLFVDAETDEGICVEQCGGTEDAPTCTSDSACAIDFDDVMAICTTACDPLIQDCARGGCYANGDDAFVCAPTIGTGALPGEPCGYQWDCAPGSVCTGGESVPGCRDQLCCAPLCDLSEPGQCDELTCAPWFERGVSPGIEEIGVCVEP